MQDIINAFCIWAMILIVIVLLLKLGIKLASRKVSKLEADNRKYSVWVPYKLSNGLVITRLKNLFEKYEVLESNLVNLGGQGDACMAQTMWVSTTDRALLLEVTYYYYSKEFLEGSENNKLKSGEDGLTLLTFSGKQDVYATASDFAKRYNTKLLCAVN